LVKAARSHAAALGCAALLQVRILPTLSLANGLPYYMEGYLLAVDPNKGYTPKAQGDAGRAAPAPGASGAARPAAAGIAASCYSQPAVRGAGQGAGRELELEVGADAPFAMPALPSLLR
jgi:hypothetical protein